ncbi:MAG TPA: AAA family ATPase [Ignavibacteriaceae bacterium]|nr:AAA family ATPase [Ignavibacteriaceae bacterium]
MISGIKTIFVVIGQKGSGKSLICSIVEELYGILFLQVEIIAREVKKERNVFDESYHNEVYIQIESQLRRQLKNCSAVIFESTGLAAQFDMMIDNLKNDFQIVSIYIKSDPELCMERINNRDTDIHINVSDKDVQYINRLVLKKNFNCDYIIENNGSRDELIRSVKSIFDKYRIEFSN